MFRRFAGLGQASGQPTQPPDGDPAERARVIDQIKADIIETAATKKIVEEASKPEENTPEKQQAAVAVANEAKGLMDSIVADQQEHMAYMDAKQAELEAIEARIAAARRRLGRT